jgi:ABC-type lipoprotein export system ATPase subunit
LPWPERWPTGPQLVLADEPTGNLDERTADRVLDEFLRLVRGEGSSALVATHNERLARGWTAWCACMTGCLR